MEQILWLCKDTTCDATLSEYSEIEELDLRLKHKFMAIQIELKSTFQNPNSI